MTANGVHIPRVLSADETSEVEKLVACGRYEEAAERFGGRVTHAQEPRDLPPVTDFETHPVGTAALLAELQAAQKYRYIGKDGKPVLARDLEDRIEQLEAALTRANAATAAAFEVAAQALDSVAKQWSCGHPSMHCDCARDIEQWEFAAAEVRGLATPDQTAALDRLIAEAEARVWEQAAQIANRHDLHDKDEASYTGRQIAKDILAASKKGGA